MDLAPDFNEFIGSLNAHGVEFLIVGAYALAEFEPVQIHVMTAISGVSLGRGVGRARDGRHRRLRGGPHRLSRNIGRHALPPF